MEKSIRPKRFALRRHQRINDVLTFSMLRSEGKVLRLNPFRVAFKSNAETLPRLGMAIPKRWAKRAVDRNRVRRWIRESFRQRQCQIGAVDVLVSLNARFSGKEDKTTERALKRVLDEAWTKLSRF